MSQNKTKNNILVVGLGLIGSSLSQSLIRSKKVGKVYGYDKDKEVISYAKEKKFINEEVNNLRDGIIESDIIIFSLSGITAQADNANVIVTIGARIKTTLLALAGIIISLNIYLRASASDCSSPNGPTTLGPLLF